MKKIISLIIVLSMIMTKMSNHIVFAAEAGDYIVNKTIKVYGGVFNTANELELDITFDARWMINNIESYNKDLSLFALLFSTDMYNDCYANADANMNDKTLFLSDFGFEDVEHHNITTSIPGVDVRDTTKMSIGNKLINISGKEYRLIMVGFQGTSNEDGWISNFDIGSSETAYFDMTGDHVDWLNLNNHKGFDVTVNRAGDVIDDYVDDIIDAPEVEKRYLFTGHSRGASIANIIGAKYIDNGEKALAYTFAAATTTDISQSVASSYKSIFNIINENDFVPRMPLTNWGFRRYGNDIMVNPATNATYKTMIENIKGSAYHSINLTPLVNALLPITNGRDDYYNINKPEYRTLDGGYDTYEDAQEEIESIRNDIAILQSDTFIEFNIIPPTSVSLTSPNLFGNSINVATESEIDEQIKKDEEIEEDIEGVGDILKENDGTVIEKDEETVENDELETNEPAEVDESVTEEDEVYAENDELEEEEPIGDDESLIEEGSEPVEDDEIEMDESAEDDELVIEEGSEPVRNDEPEVEEHIENEESEKEELAVDEIVEAFSGTYGTTDENLKFKEIVEVLKEIRNEKISEASLGDDTDTYSIEIKSCPAVMGNTIAFILAHKDDSLAVLLEYVSAYSNIVTVDTATILLNIVSVVSEDVAALGDPHFIVSYYAIVKNYVPSKPKPKPKPINYRGNSGGGGGSGGSPVRDANGQVLRPGGKIEPMQDEKCPEGITVWSPIEQKYVGTTAIIYDVIRDSFSYADGKPCTNQWIGIGDGDKNIDWYYSDANGQKTKGLVFINNSFYLFDIYGKMVTGTFVVNGQVLYFNDENGIERGKLEIKK